jgi:cation-transporting ATPase E
MNAMTLDTTTSPLQGLTEFEAQARRAKGQGNSVPPATGRTYAQIVRENVFTFINSVLFLLALALVLVGRPLDAILSVGVIATNIAVSVVQETRAKRTLDRIALLTRPKATIIRDGQERPIAPEELVVGDVLKVSAGDQIVLDGAVIHGRMSVDESQLTGESNLIFKQPGDPVYSGSFCMSGSAVYVAEKVGEASLANQITSGARAFRRVLTPLQRQINLVIRIMLLIIIYIEVLLVFNAVVKLVPAAESVTQATMIASLVPNGLFVSIAITYALAAVRIIRFGALVQQSNAVESLSSVNVLCLDKTGTLTANRLQVSQLYAIAVGEQELQSTLGAMVASAAARNKTGEAIAAAYPERPRRALAEVPFSSARKWSAVALEDDRRGVFALGAPEMLQPYLGADGEAPSVVWQQISAQAGAWTSQGLRVLLVAHHPDPIRLKDESDASRLPNGMTPLGLVSLSDELRPEAREALAAFSAMGVEPKIISGDDPETVAALARQAGLSPEIRLVSGLELDRMDEPQLAQAAASGTIFGRITPQQKERLVDSLRRQGRYVAMIGDGVNDVLSLKKANLGIAMQSGSQATRNVADIVLMNDSFTALAPAVAEGQRIVNGMHDIFKLYMARIATVVLTILSSLVIGAFPLGLRNGSLVTLLTVGIPTILLAFWARPGQRRRGGLRRELTHFVTPAAILSSLIGLLVFYGTLLLDTQRSGLSAPGLSPDQVNVTIGGSAALAQTALASFLSVCGLFLIIFVEPPTEWWTGGDVLSGDWRPTALAVGLFLAFVAIVSTPALRAFFALEPLEPVYVALVAAAVMVWMFAVRLSWRKRLIERFLELNA